jgi:hypothetical protein
MSDSGFTPAKTADSTAPPPAAAPPSDMAVRWEQFMLLASDVATIAQHVADVVPAASPLGRVADRIKGRLVQFRSLLAEQQR